VAPHIPSESGSRNISKMARYCSESIRRLTRCAPGVNYNFLVYCNLLPCQLRFGGFFSLSAINETSFAHVGAEQGIVPICIPIPLSSIWFSSGFMYSLYKSVLRTPPWRTFDVVGHTSLYRKLFLSGVRGKLWLLTYHLSQGAETLVKWQGTATDPFTVSQGVRQGGVLSTDLYKLYDKNNFLYRLV
jgi:hypothetical protein